MAAFCVMLQNSMAIVLINELCNVLHIFVRLHLCIFDQNGCYVTRSTSCGVFTQYIVDDSQL